jgi:hypothetical protein
MFYTARSKRLSLILLSAILLISLLASSACIGDPTVGLSVNNQTDQTVKIFISGLPQVYVLPREIKKFETMQIWGDDSPPWGDGDFKYLIEAKTEDGEVVYSEEFTWQELDDMDWTIVIPPPATS